MQQPDHASNSNESVKFFEHLRRLLSSRLVKL